MLHLSFKSPLRQPEFQPLPAHILSPLHPAGRPKGETRDIGLWVLRDLQGENYLFPRPQAAFLYRYGTSESALPAPLLTIPGLTGIINAPLLVLPLRMVRLREFSHQFSRSRFLYSPGFPPSNPRNKTIPPRVEILAPLLLMRA